MKTMLQKLRNPERVNVSVSVGITSWIGWLTAIGGAIPIIVKLAEEGQKSLTLSGPEKWFAIIGVVGLALTQIGRYIQSVVVAQHSAQAQYAEAVARAQTGHQQPIPVTLQLVQAPQAANGDPQQAVPAGQQN